MKVPLLDLAASYRSQEAAINQAVMGVLQSQRFIGGPNVRALEERLASYCDVPHAVGCASGSDALVLALMALDIGPGDEVITSPFTFFATAGAISRVGATPVFVDIDPASFNIVLDGVEKAITARTKAIIPVHLFGQCVDLNALEALQSRTGIPIIEDAAQAIGAKWDGRQAGSVGVLGCFSFYPSKNLGGYGDGGLITTTSNAIDARLRSLRAHGNFPAKYYHRWVGLNSRLDALQAAVLLVKMDALDSWHEARQANAHRYRGLFDEAGMTNLVSLPVEAPEAYHIYNQFCIRVPDRDRLRTHLMEAGVGTEVYYPVPLHKQECFAPLDYADGDFPESERAASEALAIPIYPEVEPAAQAWVVDQIAAFYGARVSPENR